MKVRLRLADRTIHGSECPIPVVMLRVRDRHGTYAEIPFRIDTAADFTTISVKRAQREGIPFQERPSGFVHGLAGAIEKFHDQIAVLIAGTIHTWPCDFVKEPLQTETAILLPELPPVLGRAGFLEEYTFCIDGQFLVLKRLSVLHRWWRSAVYRFWDWAGLIQSSERPI